MEGRRGGKREVKGRTDKYGVGRGVSGIDDSSE
jgi:hypothetical protein